MPVYPPNYVIGDKIRPMDMEDASETPITKVTMGQLYFTFIDCMFISVTMYSILFMLYDSWS